MLGQGQLGLAVERRHGHVGFQGGWSIGQYAEQVGDEAGVLLGILKEWTGRFRGALQSV
ncbi:hypothetical protein D3C75_1342620 [compost metagenome]